MSTRSQETGKDTRTRADSKEQKRECVCAREHAIAHQNHMVVLALCAQRIHSQVNGVRLCRAEDYPLALRVPVITPVRIVPNCCLILTHFVPAFARVTIDAAVCAVLHTHAGENFLCSAAALHCWYLRTKYLRGDFDCEGAGLALGASNLDIVYTFTIACPFNIRIMTALSSGIFVVLG